MRKKLSTANCNEEEEHDLALSELSPEIQDDLMAFAYGQGQLRNTKIGCFGGRPDTSKVKFLLYDKNDVGHPTKLKGNNLDVINAQRPIVFIIHGWLADANVIGIPTLRNSYLKEDKSNVIVVDWGSMARALYTSSYCYVPYLADHVSDFIIEVSKVTGIPLSDIHLVGHSLGAQMSGFIGKYVYSKRGQKIGRITGLDPAGPLYQLVSEKKRLCPTDADLVEVVNSNAGITGYLGKCGAVHYHLNCGTFQPMCIITRESVKPESRISTIVCDHLRVMFVWAEAVHTDQFKAKGCRKCPGFILGTCSTNDRKPTYFEMGSMRPTGNNYNVPTNSQPPFAMGCAAYPKEPCV